MTRMVFGVMTYKKPFTLVRSCFGNDAFPIDNYEALVEHLFILSHFAIPFEIEEVYQTDA